MVSEFKLDYKPIFKIGFVADYEVLDPSGVGIYPAENLFRWWKKSA